MGLQPDPIGGRPVWVLPNPSGLNAHYKPADFARVYAEARGYLEELGSPDSPDRSPVARSRSTHSGS